MRRIVRLDKRHITELAEVDFESEHQNSSRQSNREEMKKEIEKRFEKKHEAFFGIRVKGELAGYLTFKAFFPGYRHCEVYWLAVRKKYQGKGIGSLLMKFIEQHAAEKGFRKVCLYTGKNMKQTREFYEKRGYKLVNEFPGYYGYSSGNTTAVLYAKAI